MYNYGDRHPAVPVGRTESVVRWSNRYNIAEAQRAEPVTPARDVVT
jgi:hypothetical protein